MNSPTQLFTFHIHNSRFSLLLGILYLIAAILLLAMPVISYWILSILFSSAILVSGILESVFTLSNYHRLPGWGWYLTGGIADLFIGCYLIARPALGMEALPFIIALWLLIRGSSYCGHAILLKHGGSNGWKWYLPLSILTLFASFFILWYPGIGIIGLLYALAFGLLLLGTLRIIFTLEIKRLNKKIRERRENNKQMNCI